MKQAQYRKNAQIHALNRAWERFSAGEDLIKKLRRAFKRRREKTVYRDGKRIVTPADPGFMVLTNHHPRIVAAVIVDGVQYIAVYDHRLRVVVTVFLSAGSQEQKGGSHGQEKDAEKGRQKGLLGPHV